MEFGRILVSETAYNSTNLQDILNSNISVINLLREEKIDDQCIHPDALMSYYLDYYYSQYVAGNFPHFVHASGWNKELNELIEEGLSLIGATKHLELFQQLSKKVKLMSSVKLNKFINGKLEGINPVRDALVDDSFFEIDESPVTLNANSLKTHLDFESLSVEEIFVSIEAYIGREIKRE